MSLSNWDSSVSVVTMLRAGQLISNHSFPVTNMPRPALMRPHVLFSEYRGKSCQAVNLTNHSAQIKNQWSHTSKSFIEKILHLLYKPTFFQRPQNWPLYPIASSSSLINFTPLFNIMLTSASRFSELSFTRRFVTALSISVFWFFLTVLQFKCFI